MSIGDCPHWPSCGHNRTGQCDSYGADDVRCAKTHSKEKVLQAQINSIKTKNTTQPVQLEADEKDAVIAQLQSMVAIWKTEAEYYLNHRIGQMSKEILQQALDALNHIYASTPPYKENGDCTFLDKTVEISNAAIAALEVAIMQPVKPLEQFIQAVTDPENQPSQYGTVTLDYHFKKIKEWEEKFDHATNKRITDIMQPVQPAAPVAQAEPMKDGEIAKIVNDLRDVAMQFQTAGQLRERIAQVIVPVLKAKGGAA